MTYQIEDQLFKYATKEDGIEFCPEKTDVDLDKINTKTGNLTFNPTELIELDLKVYKTDVIVLTEFQSTPMRTMDDKRCRLYTALVDYANKNNKPVVLLVISTAEKTKIRKYKLNDDCVFTIPVISLKDFNGDKIISKIEYKLKNNKKITRDDMLHLSLVPFMSSKRPLDKQIEKTVQTLDKIRTNQECKSDFAFGIELLIVEKFIKEEKQYKKLTHILRDTMKITHLNKKQY